MLKEFVMNNQAKADGLKDAFKQLENNWGLSEENQELYLQIGHLFSAISRKYNKLGDFAFLTDVRRNIISVPDELADVFLALFSLARKSGTDLLSCITEVENYEITDVNTIDLCMYLTILCGQLTESIMLLENRRFNRLEDNSELVYLQSRLGYMALIAYAISINENIDMDMSFTNMVLDAKKFLSDYRV